MIKLFTLPNVVSLGNLACGCGAAAAAVGGDLRTAFWLVVAAAACDFADGMVARLTGQYSEVGRELDSLCDVVSFGVAPAAVLWSMGGGVVSIALVLFSALRLAKFNVDTSQTDHFVGLPTPACALLVVALGASMALPVWAVWVLTAVLCFLLIAPMPMFALKVKNFGWRGNEVRWIFVVIAAACVAIGGFRGVAAVIGVYILISVINLFNQKVPN